MGVKQNITSQIASLQAELAVLNRAPEDTFPFGTIVVFAAGPNGNTKWYYVKTGEEAWRDMQSNSTNSKELLSWIADALQSHVGYFEVYKLTVDAAPIFASA